MIIQEIESKLSAELCDLLYLESAELDSDKPFSELGLDSILGVELVKMLGKSFNIEVKASKLYDYPTVKLLSAYLFETLEGTTQIEPLIIQDVVMEKPINEYLNTQHTVNNDFKGVFEVTSIEGDLEETG
ncbi:acyl carrier protein, partial [Flavobacterium sp. H122]|uniref:acyl carrier protein n=1 Tax=Flavobacterium sp. H122 TaxID=2529860 RepID=UPI0010A9C83B